MPHTFSAPDTHQVFDWLWASGQPSEVDQRAIADLGMPLWVHCALNMRVSAFVYLYRRLRLGEDDAAARRVMDQVWTPDAVWSAYIADALGRGSP